MRNFKSTSREFTTPGFVALVLVLLVLGIFFRITNLDRKLYWHDEVYTTLRAAGYTRQEIDQDLFQNQVVAAPELQRYQQLKPGSTPMDTVRSLATEDPQHPPLYFLIARGWMQLFGSSLTATRSLPVLFGLLGLPLMYWLSLELFGSSVVALLAMALLALSPFDILFAQTARQYSLLTTITIGSSWLLLRSLRLSTWQSWGLYAIAATVGLYTHPFFGLTVIAQGGYSLLRSFGQLPSSGLTLGRKNKGKVRIPLVGFLGAIATALLLFSPWLWVMVTNLQRLLATTDWNRAPVSLLYLNKLWTLSFTSLFFDVDLGFNNPWTYLLRLPYLLIIGISLYTVCRQTRFSTWSFVLLNVFLPFLILALPDLISGGKRSAVSRYLIACYPGVQLAVSFWLAGLFKRSRQFWRGAMALLLVGSVVSCTLSAAADTWWSKDLSYSNAKTARLLNSQPAPLVVSDVGLDYTNTGDLISLSYLLSDRVNLLLLRQPPNLNRVNAEQAEANPLLLFRPSGPLSQALAQTDWQSIQVMDSERLSVLQKANAEGIWRLYEQSKPKPKPTPTPASNPI